MSWQSEVRAWSLAGAGLFCMGSIGYRVLTFPALAPTIAQLNGTMANLNSATGQWAAASKQQTASVSAIERDVRAQLWHVDRTLTDLDGTLTAAQGAIGGVQRTLSVTDAQLTHVGPLLDSARAATNAIPPAVAASTQTIKDIDARVADPHIASLVAHADGMSASGDKMLADAQYKTHELLHPDKVKLGFWGATWAAIKAIHQIEPPIF
jgi:ABC-type transporter Mla subunit MlaD